MQGWEDEVVAAAEAFTVEGEDCAEESAEGEIVEAALLESVGGGGGQTGCASGDYGHDLVDVPLSHDARLVEISTFSQICASLGGRERRHTCF